MNRRPRVLMVTGVYDPETSGASLQCKQLIAHTRTAIDARVLTTSADPALPRRDVVDGTPVRRVYVDPSRPGTKGTALAAMTRAFLSIGRDADVVHFHGFSQKTILLAWLARASGKRTVMKLTSVGHDDALSMRERGGAAYRAYRSIDRAIAVSPRLEQAWREAGLDGRKVVFIPNAVDTNRFTPADGSERQSVKRAHGWNAEWPVILFVGFFSHEKRPDLLFRAWSKLWEEGIRSTLVLVGPTRAAYYEIDPSIAAAIRAEAARRELTPYLVFVERAADIARYYRAADIFALPTTREGLPNVLLESMSCGVPPVISSLPGVTDWIVQDGVTGRLVSPPDEEAFTRVLREVLSNSEARSRIGAAARGYVERHFAPDAMAARTIDLYRDLLGAGERATAPA